jgi:hypothetical protein
MNDLFEDFCVRLLHDTHLSGLFGSPNEKVTIDSQSLLTTDRAYVPRILEITQTCVSETGRIHFQYRERYLLEILGCYLHISQAGASNSIMTYPVPFNTHHGRSELTTVGSGIPIQFNQPSKHGAGIGTGTAFESSTRPQADHDLISRHTISNMRDIEGQQSSQYIRENDPPYNSDSIHPKKEVAR